mmetsp:Transcript_20892/g.35409  ORF Transcript_20892/g.35409 Transcript_20892/m.35409 type:complete len:89 (+) Transcript_20892:72-338(+)
MKLLLFVIAALITLSHGFLQTSAKFVSGRSTVSKGWHGRKLFAKKEYTIPDQPLRFAKAKEANNPRVMDIDSIYKPEFVKGKTVLITG